LRHQGICLKHDDTDGKERKERKNEPSTPPFSTLAHAGRNLLRKAGIAFEDDKVEQCFVFLVAEFKSGILRRKLGGLQKRSAKDIRERHASPQNTVGDLRHGVQVSANVVDNLEVQEAHLLGALFIYLFLEGVSRTF